MFDALADLWEDAWDNGFIAGILCLILFIGLGLLALALAAAALFIFGLILMACMLYGSVVGLVRGFINYFAALKDELGGY